MLTLSPRPRQAPDNVVLGKLKQHAFSAGIADAIKLGLLNESQVDESVSRLMYVRMRTGEFDDPSLVPYRR